MLPLRLSLCRLSVLCASVLAFSFCAVPAGAQTEPIQTKRTYLGFDRNIYPGDEAMKLFKKDFAFTGYWLSPPPGEKTNSWQGKREYLRSIGYGFLLLADGRDSKEFKSTEDAAAKGAADANAAAASAKEERFATGAVVFADIEEGGRLTPNYHAYLRTWASKLRMAGFRPGVYCSGMAVHEGHGVTMTTADDIRGDASLGTLLLWVYNDACPPAAGCSLRAPADPKRSGIDSAVVWQFAQSPRRKQYTRRCSAKYAADGNCYAPSDVAHKWFLDLNSATSADPSEGAK